MTTTFQFTVEGMTCGGCARSVRNALESVPGVTAECVVPGAPVVARVEGASPDRSAIAAAVEAAGFRPVFEPA